MKIVFYDGVCNLCHQEIQFLISRDQEKILMYAPLQGQTAHKYLDKELIRKLDTIVFYDNGAVFTHSEAILNILLSISWKYTNIFRFIPRVIRDFFYRFISTFRYKIWGKNESCALPATEEKELFLD